MTGATGLVMTNYMYRVAPRDGSVVALIQNGLPTYQAVAAPLALLLLTVHQATLLPRDDLRDRESRIACPQKA